MPRRNRRQVAGRASTSQLMRFIWEAPATASLPGRLPAPRQAAPDKSEPASSVKEAGSSVHHPKAVGGQREHNGTR